MNVSTRRPADRCPVAAVVPELERVIADQDALLMLGGSPSGQMSALADRQAALESMAATGRATSLGGAALQILIAADAAADMAAAMIGEGLSGLDGQDARRLDRIAEGAARSAYAALAAYGEPVPATIVNRYWPAPSGAD